MSFQAFISSITGIQVILLSTRGRLKTLLLSSGQFHIRFCAPTPNFRALRPTFEKIFIGTKVQRKVQKMGAGRETFYEIDP